MLTLIFPCSTRRSSPDLWNSVDQILFTQIFRDNNNTIRSNFFSDPLIKYLWTRIFIRKNPEICTGHLRQLRSQPKVGKARYDRLVKDLMEMELLLNIELLPDTARSEACMMMNSKQEYDYNTEHTEKTLDIFGQNQTEISTISSNVNKTNTTQSLSSGVPQLH